MSTDKPAAWCLTSTADGTQKAINLFCLKLLNVFVQEHDLDG